MNLGSPVWCLAAIYYQDGCAHEFSQWMKVWAGTVSTIMVIAALLEVQ